MDSKSPNYISPKRIDIKLKSKKMNKEKLKKVIQCSTSQTLGKDSKIFEKKIITKGNLPLSYIQKKYKNIKEREKFISKTKRITKYNPNDLVSKKELVIDTRGESMNSKNYNQSNRKKPSYDEFRNKKYQTYKVGFRLKQDKQDNSNINDKYTNIINNNEKKSRNKLYDEEIVDNYRTQQEFYQPLKSSYILPLGYPPQVTNSLYSMLAMRKNQFMDAYNEAKEKEKEALPKIKQLQFLMDKTPMANFFSKKKDSRIYISPNNSPLPYISLLNDEYTLSEKIRFQKIMDKLTKIKKCIEDNPKKEYDIAKEFLLSIGLYEVENLYIEKLKKFVDFVKGNFLINPSKNIKENMLDILNGTSIHRPPISDVMDNYIKPRTSGNLFLEENKKMNHYSSHNNIKKENNIKKDQIIIKDNNTNNKNKEEENENNDNNIIVKNLKNMIPKIIFKDKEGKIINNNDDLEKKAINENKKELNKNLYIKQIKKSHRVESVERILNKKYQEREKNNYLSNFNQRQKEIILNHKDLSINLKRQKEIYESNSNPDLDLVRQPKRVIEILEQKFKDEEKEDNDLRAKTYASWDKNLIKGKNPRLYGGIKKNSDYEELKKRNMLTEYICLMKAKNNYEISKLNEKYKL